MVDDLKALEARVSKGFDWCYAREEANVIPEKPDEFYEKHFNRWEQMLQDYQYRLDFLQVTRA